MLVLSLQISRSQHVATTLIPIKENNTWTGNVYTTGNIQAFNSYQNYDYNSNSTMYLYQEKTTYKPIVYSYNLYHRILRLWLFDKNSILSKSKDIKPIWMGVFGSSGRSNDFRYINNFLLVAVDRFFLRNTNKNITVELSEYSDEYKKIKKILENQ